MARRRRLCSRIRSRDPKSPLDYLIGAAAIIFLAFSVQISRGQAAAQLDRDAILHHLNSVITWYRDSTTKIKSVGLSSC